MPTIEEGSTLGDVAGILHAANLLGPAAWGREPMPEGYMTAGIEDRLKGQLIELFRILHERKIPYVLVGGIAMLTFVEGRNTKDVDLILAVDSLDRLPEIVIYDRNRDFARGKMGELLVDLLFTNNPLFKLVEAKYASSHRFLETNVRSATVEGLLLLKLFALPSLYRQARWDRIVTYEADIAILWKTGKPDTGKLFDILRPHVEAGQLDELRHIVKDIQQKVDRVERAKEWKPGPSDAS